MSPVLLTFRLLDSIPPHVRLPSTASDLGRAFLACDRLLNGALSGPKYLAEPRVAEMIARVLTEGLAGPPPPWILYAYAILPNHVHFLLTPRLPLTQLVMSLKSLLARQANSILNRNGMPFWHHETYHYELRSGAELDRACDWIIQDPVRAGMVTRAADYPWSWQAPLLQQVG